MEHKDKMAKWTEHGPPNMTTYLTHYRVGDIVDIKANASEQKGMPHKCMSFFYYVMLGMN
jgi:ribosomal protein L21E